MITPEQIIEEANQRFSGTVIHNVWGEHGLFYNPGQVLKRGVYIMTVKLKYGDNDRASDLAREGIYRINTGIRKDTFRKLFGDLPGRPKAGGIVDMNYDFASTNLIMPHPVYAWMGWICILNPAEDQYFQFMNYVEEAYELAKEKFAKRCL